MKMMMPMEVKVKTMLSSIDRRKSQQIHLEKWKRRRKKRRWDSTP